MTNHPNAEDPGPTVPQMIEMMARNEAFQEASERLMNDLKGGDICESCNTYKVRLVRSARGVPCFEPRHSEDCFLDVEEELADAVEYSAEDLPDMPPAA